MASSEGLLLKHVLRDHVLAGGAAAAALLALWSPSHCLAFWLANVLIDLDHYLNLVFWSGFATFRFHRTFHFYCHIKEHKTDAPFIALEAFHTVEFALAVFICGALPGLAILRPVFWGLLFHIFVDYFHLRRLGALRSRKDSILQFLWEKRKMEAAGLRPVALYKEASEAAIRDCSGCGWAGF